MYDCLTFFGVPYRIMRKNTKHNRDNGSHQYRALSGSHSLIHLPCIHSHASYTHTYTYVAKPQLISHEWERTHTYSYNKSHRQFRIYQPKILGALVRTQSSGLHLRIVLHSFHVLNEFHVCDANDTRKWFERHIVQHWMYRTESIGRRTRTFCKMKIHVCARMYRERARVGRGKTPTSNFHIYSHDRERMKTAPTTIDTNLITIHYTTESTKSDWTQPSNQWAN